MKKILVTGKSSYVGTSLQKWLGNYPDKYAVYSISLRDEAWKGMDFSEYDVVIHTAGIAHIKETKKNAKLYYKVNRDLAFDVAKKAKADRVKQFIFLSSMSVYGIVKGVINKSSLPKPTSHYGKSKLQAEKRIITLLEEDNFKVAIIRPPMIYGKGCKGNYTRLAKLALKSPIFPDIDNKRSMIYIDNLCEFIRLIIDENIDGLFFPQNKEYVCTSQMVKDIAENHGKKIRLVKVFNPLLKVLNISIVNKVFGSLYYEKEMSKYNREFCVKDYNSSIKNTEK